MLTLHLNYLVSLSSTKEYTISGFPCVGVALSSNQGNSPFRSENTGFHFALTSVQLSALRSAETASSEFLRSEQKLFVSGGNILLTIS